MDYVDIGPSYRLKRPKLMLAVLEAAFLMGRQSHAEATGNGRSEILAAAEREEFQRFQESIALKTSEFSALFHKLKILHPQLRRP